MNIYKRSLVSVLVLLGLATNQTLSAAEAARPTLDTRVVDAQESALIVNLRRLIHTNMVRVSPEDGVEDGRVVEVAPRDLHRAGR